MDIAFATSSMSRFIACPYKDHMDQVLWIFGYLKKYKNRCIVVNSKDPILVGGNVQGELP